MIIDPRRVQVERVGHRWLEGDPPLLEELLRQHGRVGVCGGLVGRGAPEGVRGGAAEPAGRGRPQERAPARVREQAGPAVRTRGRRDHEQPHTHGDQGQDMDHTGMLRSH